MYYFGTFIGKDKQNNLLLNRKMPIREFYLDRILTELELSHDEVRVTVSSVLK